MDEKVTVIVPTKNEEKFIKECLNSFVNQTYPRELFEVFVCDGMSTDETKNIVKEYENNYSNIKLFNNPGITVPIGINLGIKNSKADIIIIFGAHAFAHKDFIKNNVKKLIESGAGCVGGPIFTISGNDKANAISLAMSSPFGVGNALFRYAKKETYVDTVAFGAYRRDVLIKIGCMDEELVRNQDDELNFRVIKNGYKILLSPDIKSYYYSRSSYKNLWKQYYQYGFWKVRVMQKHKKPAALRHVIPVLFVLGLLIGGILSVFFSRFAVIYSLGISIYLLLALVFSIKVCKDKKKYIFKVIYIFTILHLSYGIGYLDGLFTFYLSKKHDRVGNNTKTSR